MSTDAALTQILAQLQALQTSQQTMQAQLDNMAASKRPMSTSPPETPERRGIPIPSVSSSPTASTGPSIAESLVGSFATNASSTTTAQTDKERERTLYPGRVNLTTYPDQHGIKPHQMVWGAPDAATRGAVICSRLPGSIKVRNALGAHSGSYSIYRALSIAMGSLSPSHKPDYNMTDPPIEIPFSTQWKNVVSFDPWGHLVPSVFRSDLDAGLDARPSIAITRAHIKLSEIDESHRRGDIEVDGTVVHKSRPLKDENGKEVDYDPGVEISVGKAAIEPVWFLPGVAERFQISESLLRRALFEETGGMYPELITRPDIKVFLPPIGGQTVYIFGPQEYLNDESKTLTLRVHDECNGSDVFGSDICTCKPYLIYAIEECIRTAQKGGVGVVVYFRKEGRALGEVTKYLVYNLRKRGGDSADRYFKSTEMIAGVKDMRFQALMPDTLHWLGIKKIDNMVSMSDMKYDAIVGSGIPILKRYDLPEHLIPPDSRVEIDAKIAAGYFSSSKTVTEADLVKTVGRTWEETEH